MSINLGNPSSKKSANVQYTYPASNVQLTTGDKNYSFFLYNSGSQPSFSFTDMSGSTSRYISGVSTNATITANNHTISRVPHDAELVITHRSMTGSTFYVVVPLKYITDSKVKTSQIDLLLESDPNTTANFDLNLDLANPNIIYYRLVADTSRDMDIFVFDKAINVKTDKINSLNPSSIFTGKSPTNSFKITSRSKVEDEIVCNYEGETDSIAKPADTNTVNKIFIWGCALIGILFFLLFGLTNVENNISDDILKTKIYTLFGFIGFLLFFIFIGMLSAKTNTTTLNITYSSLTIMSLMIIVLSYLATKGYFGNK
jgi:hypothetical protein